MKSLLLFVSLFLLYPASFAMSKKVSCERIDDWDYNATQRTLGKHTKRMMSTAIMPQAAPMVMKERAALGFSTGGAKDANNFYENIKEGYLPKLKALTYEGIFYDHSFKTPSTQTCKQLFCPSYEKALSKDPFTGEDEYFLSVGLDSNIQAKDFARKKLNIVVVLDISGSMGSPFDRYYYDKHQKVALSKEERKKSKMKIANEALVSMIDHLKEEDRLGIVLFDDRAYNAKPLRLIEKTDIEAIKSHVLDLKQRGGTNWSSGYKAGVSLFTKLESSFKDPHEYENRIIFLTDAMPNRGELDKEGLFSIANEASKQHIYTTFIGVGVDFNNDLVEAVSKTKGSNYYAIHSAKEFAKRMDSEFDYMVTPMVFDLRLQLESDDFQIAAVYGSPEASKHTGTLMYVNTLFPSPSSEEGTRGGVVLLKLKKVGSGNQLKLTVSYQDREEKSYHDNQIVEIAQKHSFVDSKSIQKAILLARYGDLLQNFTLDMRQGCHDKLPPLPFVSLKQTCSIYPPLRPIYAQHETWERRSCPLHVSAGYQKIFALFLQHFQKEQQEISDASLHKEEDLLLSLIKHTTSQESKRDDWVGISR